MKDMGIETKFKIEEYTAGKRAAGTEET